MEEKEMTILPTVQDKWVSLKKEFQNLKNVNFLCLGNLTTEEKQLFQDKVSALFRRLGISSLSEVVTREAIYDGLSDSSCKTSLVSWALPYAQRFIYRNHQNEYSRLKLSGFKKLNCLKIVVVEKLFYRNVVKRFGIESSKRYECSCLLQDNILYATLKSNPISLFTELSRFLAAGIPESPLYATLGTIPSPRVPHGGRGIVCDLFVSAHGEFLGKRGCVRVPRMAPLSPVVTREAIYDGLSDSSCKTSWRKQPRLLRIIRREEFGLDSAFSAMEESILKKQNARLGRALDLLNENIKALCDVGNSTKKEPSAGYIGKKGIGFKSVFRVTDAPKIHSNGKMVYVHSEPTDEKDWNTCIMRPFKLKKNEDLSLEKLSSLFSNLHPSLLLFLHRLKCIKFRNLLDDSFIVMRKEAVGNDVETTEISVALTLEYDSSNGNYIPKLDQQQVFAFLPLRDYGLKFIVQADFVLSSSREEVNKDSPWNKFLLSEFPNLFVSAEQSFCSLPSFKENPAKGVSVFMSFVPLGGEVHGFFSQLPARLYRSCVILSVCFFVA
ncbi:histidine kinase-, DNA gyrase B-, and HSP90-like ATPase family protein [Tanacetum coccineum]